MYKYTHNTIEIVTPGVPNFTSRRSFFFVLEIENNCDIFWKLKKIATELSTTKAVLCVWYFDAELSTTKAVLCVWYFDAENRHTSSAALQQRNTAIYWEHRHRIVASK